MRKSKKITIKRAKQVKIFIPIDIRLSFYMRPLGDVFTKNQFTDNDLSNITLLGDDVDINYDLFDNMSSVEDGNIYALMAEGVLKNQATGADLGIYDYNQSNQEDDDLINSHSDFTNLADNNFIHDQTSQFYNSDNQEDNFAYCCLAEEDALGGANTQVIRTFKGYLEIKKDNLSIIRRSNCTIKGCMAVYIPQSYINKYKLRNGDEIVCTYKDEGGKKVLTSLLTINQQSYYMWNPNRPWFRDLQFSVKPKKINGKGEYIRAISSKFGLFKSDNVFIYINKNSTKNQILPNLTEELSQLFDKVIYINPQYNPSTALCENNNIIKFCTLFNDKFNIQVTTTLLAANHAMRLIEMGKNVAIVIDDLDVLLTLDDYFDDETPICKTILGCVKATNTGSGTSFVLIPLRTESIESIKKQQKIKNIENLGILIDGNQIDLFNSYRI